MVQLPRVGWELLACQNGASPDCVVVGGCGIQPGFLLTRTIPYAVQETIKHVQLVQDV